MQQGITIKYLPKADIDQVLAFYKNTTYWNVDSVTPTDEIVTAYKDDNAIGLYRLCSDEGLLVLRGFFVLDGFKGNGVGTAMLKKMDEVLRGRTCYLICGLHLNAFYGRSGFSVATDGDIPYVLRERMKKYTRHEMNILIRREVR